MAPLFTGLKLGGFGKNPDSDIDTTPRYSISASTTSVNEGSSVIFTITTTNVPSGTTLYWTTNNISGTVDASDFNDAATTGSFTITNGTGSVTRTLSNDVTTEGSESFQLQVRTVSTSGTIVATSQTVTINDTSTAPSWSDFTSTATFSYTGSDQTWTVPSSTTKIGVFIWGAAGGSYYGATRDANSYACGGSGGYTEAIIEVTPNETLVIVVGQGGSGVNFAPATYGGGGAGGGTPRGAGEWGTAGGGLSGVFSGPGTVFTGATKNPPAIPRAMVIAGGGGGYGLGGQSRIPSGADSDTSQLNPAGLSLPGPAPLSYVYGNMYHAAGGGGLLGENAGRPAAVPVSSYPYVIGYPGGTAAGGGSQTAGGTQVDGAQVDGQAGSQLRGGDASNSPYEYAGGGGGGGWYGGGAGASGWPSPVYGPGAAGSGFIGNTTLTYPGTGSSFSNRWTGTSPSNSRGYWLAFTTNAPRATGPISPGNSPIYTSPNSSPYYPGSAGKAPATGPGALTGNPGYIVIRY